MEVSTLVKGSNLASDNNLYDLQNIALNLCVPYARQFYTCKIMATQCLVPNVGIVFKIEKKVRPGKSVGVKYVI